jgi:hypothetical protein
MIPVLNSKREAQHWNLYRKSSEPAVKLAFTFSDGNVDALQIAAETVLIAIEK